MALIRTTGNTVLDANFQRGDREVQQTRGVRIPVTFPTTPHKDQEIVHDLDTDDPLWDVRNKDRPGDVYESATAKTPTTITLRSTTAGLQCVIVVSQ